MLLNTMFLLVVVLATIAVVQAEFAASTAATPARMFSGDAALQCVGECRRTAFDEDLRRSDDGGLDLQDDLKANVTAKADDDPTHDKLPDSAARMTEDLDEEDDDEDKAEGALAEGRATRAKRRQSLKIRKVDGAVLQMLLMLKMMPVMFISTKVAILSFLVQLKSLMLSVVSAGIAAVQFFWRFQEKRQRASLQATHAAGLAAQQQAAQAGWTDEHGLWPDRRKYISY
ncbi:uncharacterized protein LOC117642149 [Thrips palmi]|uniref:Uncharacterized protein LOC117642149 n=1 Tax=Thrips palmi TaxID=161013 RepID=A0A6P8YG96_THRPL|nr:uncharacterized protein LOC117642149 [Thrips palmi]